jgi:hypothetical protein
MLPQTAASSDEMYADVTGAGMLGDLE